MKSDHSQLAAGRFWKAIVWELVQNLPLIAGFVLSLHLWQRDKLAWALVCMIAGSALGSLAIWATEAQIVPGHHEPLRVVVTNVVMFAGLMVIVAAYLSTAWSRWWLDLVLGVIVGAVLGAAQDLAARSPIGLGHCMALGLSFALGLMGVRLLTTSLPLAWSILIITVVLTVAIVAMDYGAIWSGKSPKDPIS
jgi:uncharacterized membrane protein